MTETRVCQDGNTSFLSETGMFPSTETRHFVLCAAEWKGAVTDRTALNVRRQHLVLSAVSSGALQGADDERLGFDVVEEDVEKALPESDSLASGINMAARDDRDVHGKPEDPDIRKTQQDSDILEIQENPDVQETMEDYLTMSMKHLRNRIYMKHWRTVIFMKR